MTVAYGPAIRPVAPVHLPLSPSLVAELRARDAEYRASYGGRRGQPREVRPSAHGTAAGLRVHHERGEPACRTCAGLLAELHQAGLLQRVVPSAPSTPGSGES